MKEKDFQSKFNHWVKNIHRQTGAFELKVAKNNAVPFAAVAPHQLDALYNAKHGVLVYKIPDVGFQNPFDCLCLAYVRAYVVLKYTTGMVYLIDIDVFIKMSNTFTTRSISERKASEFAEIKFNIKN